MCGQFRYDIHPYRITDLAYGGQPFAMSSIISIDYQHLHVMFDWDVFFLGLDTYMLHVDFVCTYRFWCVIYDVTLHDPSFKLDSDHPSSLVS